MLISKRHMLAAVAGTLLTTGMCLTVRAQNSSEIQNLAVRTSNELVKLRPTTLVIAPREGCILALSICETFDSALRADLRQAVPRIRIVGREEAATELKKNGLLAIDASNPIALALVGISINAEDIITEDLLWEKHGYRLRIDILNPKTDERLIPGHSLEIKMPRPVPDTSDNPILVTDPDSQVSVIVFKGPMPEHFVYPGCNKCPDPRSLGAPGTVQAIGTITAQGKVENVTVVITPGPGFTRSHLINALGGSRHMPAEPSRGNSLGNTPSE